MAVADMQLDRHAVIEASAGTGKTHALVQLVVRLLTETGARLDEILLVTFTEKATGELKNRVREALEDLAQKSAAFQDEVRAALDAFDGAAVFTIHGFCQRILQEHAGGNGLDLAPELVDDGDLYVPVLREIQRSRWREAFGELLPDILNLADFDGDAWEDRIVKLAAAYRPCCRHRLLPEVTQDVLAAFRTLDGSVRAEHATLRALAGITTNTAVEETTWWQAYSALEFKYRDGWRDGGLRPVLDWLVSPLPESQACGTFIKLVQRCRKQDQFKKYGFVFPVARIPKSARKQIPADWPAMEGALKRLDDLRRPLAQQHLEQALAAWTVPELQAQLDLYKRERGLQSFDDLLTRVDAALSAEQPQALALLHSLRERFRYAVVDEFQDTDPVQWRIFQRIFVDGSGGQRLFVVGDPKQAIFGFRGADLQAYLEAVHELQSTHEAARKALSVNWRSDGRLLEALNHLFQRGRWFAGTGIAYEEVAPAPAATHPYRLVADASGRAALTIGRLEETRQLSAARRRWAWFIAAEIRRLLDAGPEALRYSEKGAEPVALQASDLCVLVARRREARHLVDAFREHHIDYTFFKEPGLWQAAEAAHLAYLLRAIARPGDVPAMRAALLTRFFRLRPEDLVLAGDFPANSAAGDLFLLGRELAAERRWAAFFHSLVYKTGVLFHEPDAPDAERRRANLLHVVHALEHEAYRHDLDLLDLIGFLEEKIRHGGREEDNTQPIETDRSKVKIMTIHASKGLEFPVVFLAGGFTSSDRSAYLSYRDDDNRLIFDLRHENADSKAKHKAVRGAEERRLYYVALTRAIFKLYLPWVIRGTGADFRQQGPVITILGAAMEAAQLGPEKLPGVGMVSVTNVPLAAIGSAPAAKSPAPAPGPIPVQPLAELFPRLPADLGQRRVRIRSFSSLHREAAADRPVYLHGTARAADEGPPAAEQSESFRGPVFGEMLHDILETIDFAEVGAAAGPDQLPPSCRRLIDDRRLHHWAKLPVRMIAGGNRPGDCIDLLARLTWNALHAPLPGLGPLWQVPAADRLHELEFHFPARRRGSLPPGIQRQEEFLTGFMDLVIRRDGRYYLVDWKTNALPSYAPEDVARSVIECDYVRQYRLYLQALERWLGQRLRRFDPVEHLAGVFYLYVRGLSSENPGHGVYHHRPSREDFDLAGVLSVG